MLKFAKSPLSQRLLSLLANLNVFELLVIMNSARFVWFCGGKPTQFDWRRLELYPRKTQGPLLQDLLLRGLFLWGLLQQGTNWKDLVCGRSCIENSNLSSSSFSPRTQPSQHTSSIIHAQHNLGNKIIGRSQIAPGCLVVPENFWDGWEGVGKGWWRRKGFQVPLRWFWGKKAVVSEDVRSDVGDIRARALKCWDWTAAVWLDIPNPMILVFGINAYLQIDSFRYDSNDWADTKLSTPSHIWICDVEDFNVFGTTRSLCVTIRHINNSLPWVLQPRWVEMDGSCVFDIPPFPRLHLLWWNLASCTFDALLPSQTQKLQRWWLNQFQEIGCPKIHLRCCP